MGIVRLRANGEVEVIDPGTPEDQARVEEKLLNLARTLGRMMAEQDWKRHIAEQRESRSVDIEGGE